MTSDPHRACHLLARRVAGPRGARRHQFRAHKHGLSRQRPYECLTRTQRCLRPRLGYSPPSSRSLLFIAHEAAAIGPEQSGQPNGHRGPQVRSWAQIRKPPQAADFAEIDIPGLCFADQVATRPPKLPQSTVHPYLLVDNAGLGANLLLLCAALDWEVFTLGGPNFALMEALIAWTKSDVLPRENLRSPLRSRTLQGKPPGRDQQGGEDTVATTVVLA